jgi:hypothetical protein
LILVDASGHLGALFLRPACKSVVVELFDLPLPNLSGMESLRREQGHELAAKNAQRILQRVHAALQVQIARVVKLVQRTLDRSRW